MRADQRTEHRSRLSLTAATSYVEADQINYSKKMYS